MAETSFLIVSAEDDEDDRFLLRESFNEAPRNFVLEFVNNGEEAWQLLTQAGTWPSLLLLDINMPGLTGLSLLERIRKDEQLKTLPVLILTTSEDSKVIQTAYRLGVNGYVVKPSHYVELKDFWDSVQKFWLQTTHLPQKPS
ncbi:hypothetical protein BWI93_03950 [Siphonobacter sp. BAB-5385]|uniref:response regulator n=1 Tax=unclassified Siphonobacter TaxID=2635712 RepID=UPI000B9E4908|nr:MULTISPECIES: response regulator [unclassified Siphonobacter]OZI09468.1 hypothetical protein BWI93_03950 [Siphonobacter sp. BAB-5385]PMD86564.1 hypothetical protein BWI97_26270 [Siphonobacter sp. BAB-5405]